MSVKRITYPERIHVKSGVSSHHMTVGDLLAFADEVAQAVADGLDPKVRLEVRRSQEGHTIGMFAESDRVDTHLCGVTFTPPHRMPARCTLPKDHLLTSEGARGHSIEDEP